MTANDHLSMPAIPESRNAARATRRLIVAASIGNALEFYEIAVYSYFARVMGTLFFPSSNPELSLIASYATFSLSFIARPVGALVLGRYADRHGRRRALLVSISLMMAATLLLCILPTYQSAGIVAPLGLVVSRLVQGFAVAGEFASSTALLAEHDPRHKGFLASWQFASQGASALIASLFGVALSMGLSADQMSAFGWRLPFVFGLLIGPIGLYVRRHLDESPELASTPPAARTPLADLWRHGPLAVIVCTGIVAMSTGTNYLISYMPSFAQQHLHLSAAVSFWSTVVAGLILIVVCPLAGRLSDGIGRLPMMRATALLALIVAAPAFSLLTLWPGAATLMAAVAVFALLKAVYAGPMPALMAELFPSGTRATALALAYNFGVMIFGGSAPVVAESLIASTGWSAAPAAVVIVDAIVALAALALAPRWLAARPVVRP